jgi:asparagine synthase (glutamine-hydrolysing)
MSVQFGKWNFDGQPPAPDYIGKVTAALARYGPDSNELYSSDGLTILYRAFHTTKESHCERQPHVSSSGAVITWDGRLDNRADLISELRDSLTSNSTDVAIAAASYEKWGASSMGKLIGDWALSIWNPRERSMLLAKDPIGTRQLYYSFDEKQLTWSTILDPLVLFAGKTLEICKEYVAGWFLFFPATHLTPYVGIHSVPPSSSVLLRPGKRTISKYWDFDPGKLIRYKSDGEYEEHFRSVLGTAVGRRLRSDRPVLAELSGGMDSSSIVCTADALIARGAVECPRLDTISWFDDSYDHLEPDSNELHWIARVEEKRQRTGFHINLAALEREESSLQKSIELEFDNDNLAVTPHPNNARRSGFLDLYIACMRSHDLRVTLSGIGGDEATGGGVPTPVPELQNLLTRARFLALVRQLNAWAAKMKKPQLLLLWRTIQGFLPRAMVPLPQNMHLLHLFYSSFVRRNRTALYGYPCRTKLAGPLPSFQNNLTTLEANRRYLTHRQLTSEPLREVRYPYFDRTLLEFVYAVPPEQVVRVGRRRSLMKRALVGIVPDELLNRKRKAFVPGGHREDFNMLLPNPQDVGQSPVGSALGIIDIDRLVAFLQQCNGNNEILMKSLMRTVRLEFWLRHLRIRNVLTVPTSTKRLDYPDPRARTFQAHTQHNKSAS